MGKVAAAVVQEVEKVAVVASVVAAVAAREVLAAARVAG